MNGKKRPVNLPQNQKENNLMSNAQKPLVGIGTQLPTGTVTAIKRNHTVLVDTGEGIKEISFSEVERLIKC